MLAKKNNNEIYIVISYQKLFIKNWKEFVNREVIYCEVL